MRIGVAVYKLICSICEETPSKCSYCGKYIKVDDSIYCNNKEHYHLSCWKQKSDVKFFVQIDPIGKLIYESLEKL